MNYTKGEWKRYGLHIHRSDGRTASEIATVLACGWMAQDEAVYNAQLIAAAPLMYEALKLIASANSIVPGDVVDIACKALEKVERK